MTQHAPRCQAGMTFQFLDIEFQGVIDASPDNNWTLAAFARSIRLSTILEKALGQAVPEELPDLIIDHLSLTLTNKGKTALKAQVLLRENKADTAHMHLGSLAFPLASLELDLQWAPKQASIAITVTGAGLKLTNDIAFESFSFTFNSATEQGWSVQGTVVSRILNEEFALSAQYSHRIGSDRFTLIYREQTVKPLLSLPGVLTLDVRELSLSVSKESATDLQLSARGGLSLAQQIIVLKGTILAHIRSDGALGLTFSSEQAKVSIPLPVAASLDLEFAEIAIAREGGEQGNAWLFTSAVALSCPEFHRALPANIRSVFPERINTAFRADETGISLRADRVLNPIDIPLPDLEIDQHTRIPLGLFRLDVGDLHLSIGKELHLGAEFRVGLPSRLNSIFGVDKDGNPELELFRTFDPEHAEETLVKLAFSAGTDGFTCVATSSPLKAIELQQSGGKVWWRIELGEFGQGMIQVPKFSYVPDTGAFQASGGFKVTRELALPLFPIKRLLEASGCQGAAKLLPERLPLADISLLDAHDNFRAEEFCHLLNSILPGKDLPQEIRRSVEIIGHFFDKLPDDFRSYLHFVMPRDFAFDIAITADGGIRFKIGVEEGSPPIKLLYPTMIGPLPGLQGIELHSLSFGLILGGAVGVLQADLCCDTFDLVSLAAALILPDEHHLPLPDPNDFHRRLIIDDLCMFIILCTAIPIPIPLFYDELGVEYLGLEGVTLEAHIKFPMPRFDLQGITVAVANFISFVSDPNALMDPDALGKMDLSFSVGSTYLQLPQYLGSQLLGYKGPDVSVKAFGTLAKLMNMVKRFSITDLLESIPLSYRIGNEQVEFGPLVLDASWLMTTPEEFRSLSYQQLSLKADQAKALLDIAAASGGTAELHEEGIVLFLKGGAGMGNWCHLECVFALMASGSLGFHTGFSFEGWISGLIYLRSEGRVDIHAQDSGTTFCLAGASELRILDEEIFTGDIQLSDRQFTLSGKLDLFPKISLLTVKGAIQGVCREDYFLLSGGVMAELCGLTLAGAEIFLSNERIFLKGTLLGVTAELEVEKRSIGLALHGQISLDIWGIEATTAVDIDHNSATLRALMPPVDLGIFKMHGPNGGPLQSLLAFENNTITEARYTAEVEFLGLKVTTGILLSSSGFFFQTSGNLFEKTTCSLAVRGSFATTAGIQVQATLQDNLLADISNKVIDTVSQAIHQASDALQEQRKKVEAQQAELERFDAAIDQQRKQVESDRKRAQDGLKKAQQDVAAAQTKVDAIKNDISHKEEQINQLKKGRYVKVVFVSIWTYDDPLALVKMAALRTEITVLWVGYGGATAVLATAVAALKVAEGLIKITPIDLDPRVAVPLASRKAVDILLEGEKQLLLAAEKTAHGLDDLTRYLQKGARELLCIHSATFTAGLDRLQGGTVQVDVLLTIKGQQMQRTVLLDLKNPVATAVSVSKFLLP